MSIAASQGLPNLFTINIPAQGDGTIGLGYINQNEYTGDISYVDTHGSRQRTISGRRIRFGTSNPRILHGHDKNILVDSGSAAIYLPQHLAMQYYEAITGHTPQNPGYTRAGNQYLVHPNAVFPDIHIDFGNYILPIYGNRMRRSLLGNGKVLLI